MCIFIRKTAVFCIFILLVIGLFLTCDDPNNPFSNNLGEKVVVEPPVIEDISPVSGSYLRDVVTFTAKAKAYIKVERVEVCIYEDKVNGQREVKWTSNGIKLTGGIKQKTMEFEFDTRKYNNWDFRENQEVTPKDGPIRMQFRIFDSTNKPKESIELIYIIKNNPSVIKMVYPSDIAVEKSGEPANVTYGGDIRGSITDRRGLRPGFPQIKLWADNEDEPPGEEGWATLFLTGYDDMEKEGADAVNFPAGHGRYADRSQMRVVNAASFSLRLAAYDIIPDPVNPDIRRVSYKITDDGIPGMEHKHELFSPNKLFKFKIRTRDVAPDPFKGSIPSEDPPKPWPVTDGKELKPWIEGFYPPRDFGTGNVNWFEMRGLVDGVGVEEPVRIRVFNADTRPIVEINNDDIEESVLKLKPNKYITEAISKKIVQNGFRLQLFARFEKSDETVRAVLEYEHSGISSGPLPWDEGKGGVYPYPHPDGRPGTLFTYTSDPEIFKDSSDPYTLLFRVVVDSIEDPNDWPVYRYVVYMDGRPPNVSIRSVQGAADVKLESPAFAHYTVNGNIQAVVDRTDDSGIMPFRENSDMGERPPPKFDADNYPMVKWIVEEAASDENEPPATGFIQTKLDAYRNVPNWDNLRFFRDITDTQSSSLTSLPSGWVMLPLPEGTGEGYAKIDADKNYHFKLNTQQFTDKGISYVWIYVIAMDQVQNLGYIARKIYIDQETDKPNQDTKPLSETNADGKHIEVTGADGKLFPVPEPGKDIQGGLDVRVTISTNSTGTTQRLIEGNWEGTGGVVTDGIRNNILGRNDNISLNFIDDDGINLDKGGVTIILTNLNVTPNITEELTIEQIKEALNETSNNNESKRDLSGTLTQKLMATVLFVEEPEDGSLRDGIYKIEITVKDDIEQKVAITPHVINGDTPVEADKKVTYYFAVSTEKPDIKITFPDDNALGSANPQDIYGTVKSRFAMQHVWISFSPEVALKDPNGGAPIRTKGLIQLPLTTVGEQPDADGYAGDGYYEYTWIQKDVIFNPPIGLLGDLRRFTVEAYDRLGNLSEVVRNVRIDDSPPDLKLLEFNYNRPAEPDKDGNLHLYLYGKVPFTVSASDSDGLYEIEVNGVKMSGVKWWVLPANASKPDWNTEFRTYTNPTANLTPSTWKGGGNFTVAQMREDSKFVGVIDTRYLAENTEYKFYCMAMDKAGNIAPKADEVIVILQPNITSFTVDQNKDYPVIYENTLNPMPNSVLGNEGLIISGTVSDADLFSQIKNANDNLAKTYVQIRYPATLTPAGLPATWSAWIPIPIPATFGTGGGIDPAGAIVYKFNPTTHGGAETYFKTDGIKYYQIRVTDEPDLTLGDDGKNLGGNYGKNPDEFMRTATDKTGVQSPVTDPNYNPNYGNLLYPGYNSIYLRHDSVSIVFPMDPANPTNQNSLTLYYTFIVDNTPPEIFFNRNDPTLGHPNYAINEDGSPALRPTFSKWEQLKRALNNQDPITGAVAQNGKGNFVKEYKLVDLTMSWSAGSETFIKVILNNPPNPATDGEYPWGLNNSNGGDWSADDDTRLQTIFNAAPQGMQVISFEATDLVPKNGRVSWIFAKDTQGPEINFNNISRSIKRTLIPPESNFPSSPPLANKADAWPTNVTKWNDAWNSITWNGSAWKVIIENWPSEYAFRAAAEVYTALDTENKREPSTVIGDDNTDAVIEGTFNDEYSSVRILPTAITPKPQTYFYYRFKDKKGVPQTIPSSGLNTGITPITVPTLEYTDTITTRNWIRKEIEPAKDKQSEKEADWKITLNEANGFTGPDGENWVDIRIADTADNISEIYNVRFLLDRAPPLVGRYDGALPSTQFKPGEFRISYIGGAPQAQPGLVLPEAERVIGAAGAGTAANTVFSVSGRVNDYNLSNLRITIGQDGFTAYTVTASADIDLLKSYATPPNTGPGVTYTDDKLANDVTDTGVRRLTLAGPYRAGTTTLYTSDDTGTPEWEWTLNILEKDVKGLRDAAKNDTIDAKDSTRRFIRVTASDKAGKRAGPIEWAFYLDTKRPVIEYTNLDKGRNGSSFEGKGVLDVKLSGLVSDDTRIRDVKYMIGRWEYGATGTNKWRWYDGNNWTLAAPPAVTSWPSAFDSHISLTNTTLLPRPTPAMTMDFAISQLTLNAAGITKFPANLFSTEGQYRIDLYVTDFSRGNTATEGNPHNTTLGNNDELSVSANGFKDFGYDAATDAGNVSARVFYIDKDDPILRWATAIEEKTYFRNETTGQVIFGFIAGDGNTLQNWTAEVRENGTIISISNGTTWQNGTTANPQTAIPVPQTVSTSGTNPPVTTPPTEGGKLISETSINEQYFEIKPYMTTTGTSAGTPLDVGKPTLPTYSITITVTDGAKRTSSITKQFTLDNTPPRFIQDKFNPLSFKQKADGSVAAPDPVTDSSYTPATTTRTYSFDAITGRLNIRGNTEDNSNQIKSISYYVVSSDDSSNWTAFPSPANITAANWRSTANNNTEIKTTGGTTLIELDEGTLFAWSIRVPQTSLFLTTDATAVKYRQPATTNGIPINGGDSVSDNKYRDVTVSSDGKTVTLSNPDVPKLEFPDLNNTFNSANPKVIYGGESVAFIVVYVRAEDAAGNVAYDVMKYWIWPEGDRPIITAINTPDSSKTQIERLLNGTIRISGMAKDNERVQYVWFRVLDDKGVPYGTGAGTNGKELHIPEWNETTWEAKGSAEQKPKDGKDIGARRVTEPVPTPDPGWYMANGGNSKDVGWWAYINTNGELDPTGTEESKKFTVEVRAQDVTYDEKYDRWMPYEDGYTGMSSAMTNVSKVDAWVVAGAPIFENQWVAPDDSNKAENASPKLWDTIDNLYIRNRSSYKVTVKHNSGLSSVRWSPTFWNKALSSGGITGAFQANPNLDSVNLLDLKDTTTANPEYFYVYRTGAEAYAIGRANQTTVFTNLNAATAAGTGTNQPRMALTIQPRNMLDGSKGNVTLKTDRRYMVWNWDEALETRGVFPYIVGGIHDTTHFTGSVHKDMKNSVFTPPATGVNLNNINIGNAILIESEEDPSSKVHYFKWDVIVDMRADLLLKDIVNTDTTPISGDDPAYGNGTAARAGQVRNSVRYPLYLSASEVSKATPLTSRGDTTLPIDNLAPYGMYTLNRKPAGTAVTIGGEAGDDGPVAGIARVVLWFQRKDGPYVSWHQQAPKPETTLPAGAFTEDTTNSGGPVWWNNVKVGANEVIPAGVRKPAIPVPNAAGVHLGTGGDSAIVIDTNSPSRGIAKWGHTLPMGFADGGIGKLWYVEINSYGLESGPVDLHYVIIDKAGNAKYYKERLIIMNNVAVIDRVKLATDIRHISWAGTNLATNRPMTSNKKIDDKAEALVPTQWPILHDVRKNIPFIGTNTDIKDDVKKGITDWISFSALGPDKVIDFNVRNSLFALRVETTKGATQKTRNFRLEYVNSARLMSDTNAAGTRLTDIEAGRMYVINNRGTARWGMFGADGDDWKPGYAFIATVSGKDLDTTAQSNIGEGSAWELNPGYPAIGERHTTPNPAATGVPASLRLEDAKYALADAANAESAEFVYANAAFTNGIVDTGPANAVDAAWPPTSWPNNANNNNYSLFILRVFDGLESDMFGDFVILRVRINNDDKTPPFAQLYDLNPKTEGQDRSNIAGDSQTVEERRSVSPMFVGEGTGSNRTKGGLWNTAAKLGDVDKPGHIEPRRVTTYTTSQQPYRDQQHSLSSAQMGGAATKAEASIIKPWADPEGFFATDTVSGQVVLRGYAEDDQRVQRVNLVIGGETITILDYPTGGTTTATEGDTGTSVSPKTGMLAVPSALAGNPNATPPVLPKVYFTDSIDLYRHRVEWAYVWDTETIPASTVVGNNVIVSVVSYPRDGAAGATPKTANRSAEIRAPGDPHVSTPDKEKPLEATRPNTSPYNRDFPVNLNKYNYITVNLRPYITGFLRNQTNFSHNTRSRQGRYMFARGETAVLKGFNLGSGSISIPGMNNTTTSNVGTIGDFGITTANNNHYRQFTIGTGATTGNGLVTYVNSSRDAVNTGSERTRAAGTPVRPRNIQPWNIEYSPNVDGSTLWDDFTQVHIWQSNDTTSGGDNGRFPKGGDNMEVFDPAMSIDPANGNLWESHNEGGGGSGTGGNTGSTRVSNNNNVGSFLVASFIDPITNSDIFISPRQSGYNTNNWNYTVWTASSIIGKPGGGGEWRNFGGIWINGPGGGNVGHTSGVGVNTNNGFDATNSNAARGQYHGESTFYNAFPGPGNNNPPSGPTLNQFKNPHIVSYWDNSNEHIHVSYYDTKDKSVKYRYNRRGAPETVSANTGGNYEGQQGYGNRSDAITNIPRGWTNLDGGTDAEDQNAASNAGNWFSVATGGSNRIVTHNGANSRSADAGEYNSIAMAVPDPSQRQNGYPVIAYYDKAGQKLKLAISNNNAPIAGSNWTIIPNVITNTAQNPDRQTVFTGTGEYVSMRIDARAATNIVHIAAMNSMNKSVVYIRGTLTYSGTTPTYTTTDVQVVDSVGSVGRWCALSLDSNGNPWISYQDESYQGSRDGVKVAYLNTTTYYKGTNIKSAAYYPYQPEQDVDINNVSVNGWEAMHVPTQFRVENARQGMECFPTISNTGASKGNGLSRFAAVGYLGQNYFRAAYYVE